MFKYLALDSEQPKTVSLNQLRKVVNDHDMITLEYESSLYDTTTSFEEWIKFCKVETCGVFKETHNCGVFKETHNCKLITKVSYICSFEKAYALIHSPEWDGECYNFSDRIMANKTFCESVITSRFWNGKIDCFTNPMQDEEFCDKILTSPMWNGEWVNTFTSYRISSGNFFDKLLNSPKWNGKCKLLGPQVLNNIALCKKIIDSNKWDGRVSYFGNIPRADFDLCFHIIHSSKWNGDCNFDSRIIWSKKFQRSLFESNKYKELLSTNVLLHKLMLGSPRWDGSIKQFPEKIQKDINFCLFVVESDKWNKNYLELPQEIIESSKFRVLAKSKLKRTPFKDGRCYDLNFCINLLQSPKWTGNLNMFHPKLFDSLDFSKALIHSGRWNGLTSMFSKNLMNNKSFCITVIQSPHWCDSFLKFEASLRSDKDIIKELNNAPRFSS